MTGAAFGFRIDGDAAPDDGWLAVEGAEGWPVLTLRRDPAVARHDEARVDGLRRTAGVSAALPPDEVVHPLLGRMLPFLAGPRGIDAAHGGILLGRDGAWAVIGPREAGKSSLLAACHGAGVPVLSDDIVVLEGRRCLAGPRCIDLREPTARALGAGEPVRDGTKRRIRLPAAPAEAEMAGVVHLAWGPSTELVELRPTERLARLAALRAERLWPRDAALVLELAALPTFELRRPARLEELEDQAALVRAAIGA